LANSKSKLVKINNKELKSQIRIKERKNKSPRGVEDQFEL
jgi:hypothetical protein